MSPGDGETVRARVEHLFVSGGHNFVGHHGVEPGTHAMIAVDRLECVAGRGIRGDRFFDHRPDFKGQITFFAMEVHEAVGLAFGLEPEPWRYRRNVLVRGMDLGSWIGRRFWLQGIPFEGTEECRPCYWMDRAVAPGVEEFLKGRGGLRARILDDGVLRIG